MRIHLNVFTVIMAIAMHQVHAIPAATSSPAASVSSTTGKQAGSSKGSSAASGSASSNPSPSGAADGKNSGSLSAIPMDTTTIKYSATSTAPRNSATFAPSQISAAAKDSASIDAAASCTLGSSALASGASSAKPSGSVTSKSGTSTSSSKAKGAAKTPSARMYPPAISDSRRSSGISPRREVGECQAKGHEVYQGIRKAKGKKDDQKLVDAFKTNYVKPGYSNILKPLVALPADYRRPDNDMSIILPHVTQLLTGFQIFRGLDGGSFYTGYVGGWDAKKGKVAPSHVNLYVPKHDIVVGVANNAAYDMIRPRSNWDVVALQQYQKVKRGGAPKYVLRYRVERNRDTKAVMDAIFKTKPYKQGTWYEIRQDSAEATFLLGTPLGEGAGRMLADFPGSMKRRGLEMLYVMRERNERDMQYPEFYHIMTVLVD